MKQETLEMLKKMYAKTRDIIWILDDKWNIVWSNFNTMGIVNVSAILKVEWNCWEETEKIIYWNEREFQYLLECNQDYGYRVARLHEADAAQKVSFDVKPIGNIVHFLINDIQQLYDFAQKKNLPEMIPSLDMMMSNCWRVHRIFFIERLLKRLQKNMESKESLSVSKELEIIKERMESAFGSNADVEIQFIETQNKQKCIYEEKQFFHMVILAAVIMCWEETQHRKAVTIQVRYTFEQITIQLSVETLSELCKDSERQPDISALGDTEPEKIMLETFCRRHGGIYIMPKKTINSKGREVVSCQINFKSDMKGIILRRKSRPDFIGEFNNAYFIMLSRICFQNFFREKRRK